MRLVCGQGSQAVRAYPGSGQNERETVMEVRLLVSKWCPVCPQAEEVWAEVAKRKPIDYQVLDIAEPPGRALVAGLRIRTVPALVVDGKLVSVGLQSLGDALKIVDPQAA